MPGERPSSKRGVYHLGPAAYLRPGQRSVVEVEGVPVMIINLRGTLVAYDARCPHLGGPLEAGTLWGHEIECPWHHYVYDLWTGENRYPKRVYPADMPWLAPEVAPLERYPVRVEGGEIVLELPRQTGEEHPDPSPGDSRSVGGGP